MAKQRHLDRAPIVEAIVDFRVKLASSFDVTVFASLEDTLKPNYPSIEKRTQFEAGVEVDGKQVHQVFADKGLHGYFFKSADAKNVAQFRRDGFTFSRLPPYPDWDTVITEAKALWQLYCVKASPEQVTRIAVRYINQLPIPLPIDDYTHYLEAPPAIPDTLPQEVRHFMTRVVLFDELTGIQANVIQALGPPPKPGHASIILDIDVYKHSDVGFKDDDIWPTFQQLRALKNRIFFDSITEKTAELFE